MSPQGCTLLTSPDCIDTRGVWGKQVRWGVWVLPSTCLSHFRPEREKEQGSREADKRQLSGLSPHPYPVVCGLPLTLFRRGAAGVHQRPPAGSFQGPAKFRPKLPVEASAPPPCSALKPLPPHPTRPPGPPSFAFFLAGWKLSGNPQSCLPSYDSLFPLAVCVGGEG